MMSLFATASMLPCGRYYYEPEGGYVGHSWVKFSWQYIFLYLAWIIHHLDAVDHFIFQFFQTFNRKCLNLYNYKIMIVKRREYRFVNFHNLDNVTAKFVFHSSAYNMPLENQEKLKGARVTLKTLYR